MYQGLTYPRLPVVGWQSWMYWLWRKAFCRRNMHLFDEVWSPYGEPEWPAHYLACDACGLMVIIKKIDKQYLEKK